MISLRLTESEYSALINMTTTEGVRGTSELARMAICDYLTNHRPDNGRAEMLQRIADLESEVGRLSRILEGFANLTKERS